MSINSSTNNEFIATMIKGNISNTTSSITLYDSKGDSFTDRKFLMTVMLDYSSDFNTKWHGTRDDHGNYTAYGDRSYAYLTQLVYHGNNKYAFTFSIDGHVITGFYNAENPTLNFAPVWIEDDKIMLYKNKFDFRWTDTWLYKDVKLAFAPRYEVVSWDKLD